MIEFVEVVPLKYHQDTVRLYVRKDNKLTHFDISHCTNLNYLLLVVSKSLEYEARPFSLKHENNVRVRKLGSLLTVHIGDVEVFRHKHYRKGDNLLESLLRAYISSCEKHKKVSDTK